MVALMEVPTHPDFAHFLPVDGDVLTVDLDVGQAHVGDGFHTTADVVLALHLEGHQGGVVPAGFGHGVGAGALEVEIEPVEGFVVGVTPSPAGGNQGWDTPGLSARELALLLGPAPKGFAGVWKEKKPWEKPREMSWGGAHPTSPRKPSIIASVEVPQMSSTGSVASKILPPHP
uniref:Uncharacterized protein n=1 Tax=Bubo bubo TaxID=30461 RepID=A0A8C0F3H6_BUBBB